MDESLERLIQQSIALLPFVYRIVAALVCDKKAKKLNRNKFWWAVFGLALPTFALIWIHLIKPKLTWDKH